MTCNEFDALLADYLTGRMVPADAEALEGHAAACARCEQVLERHTRLDTPSSIATPPAALRADVLRNIAVRRRRRTVRRYAIGSAGIAAAAIVALTTRPATKSAADFPGAAAVLLAADHARPELAALDAAERDLQAAIRRTPDDAELRDDLARVSARREAMSRQIRAAAS